MTNPRKEIFNNLADEWDTNFILTKEQKEVINHVVDYSDISETDKILDVGCGTGVLTPYLRYKIGEEGEITGLDVSDKMIEKANAKFNDRRIKFISGDIYEHNLSKNYYDKIFVFSAFPHLHDKKTVLEIFNDLLKDKGKLIIFHVESSHLINTYHKENVESPVLKKDYLPNLDEMKEIIDKNKWHSISLQDAETIYLVLLQKI